MRWMESARSWTAPNRATVLRHLGAPWQRPRPGLPLRPRRCLGGTGRLHPGLPGVVPTRPGATRGRLRGVLRLRPAVGLRRCATCRTSESDARSILRSRRAANLRRRDRASPIQGHSARPPLSRRRSESARSKQQDDLERTRARLLLFAGVVKHKLKACKDV